MNNAELTHRLRTYARRARYADVAPMLLEAAERIERQADEVATWRRRTDALTWIEQHVTTVVRLEGCEAPNWSGDGLRLVARALSETK